MDYTPGNLCHLEIPASDIAAMQAFYGEVFGWTFQPMNDAYIFFDAGNIAGAFDASMEAAAGGVVLVLAVEEIDASLAQITAAGGEVVQPKTEIADGHGHYAKFKDVSGNTLGIWTPAPA